ncbi:Pao retrotransposon peptidase [Popillia japonica]|uniref:Pao retrotransposon peptidase n=1 Tax=Popillia japonica TaxID=7064 RepID=A0AAW1JTP1_POPJA
MRDFYVVDWITGADTPDEVNIIINQTSDLLQGAVFELRKWHLSQANVPNILHIDSSTENIQAINPTDNVKALGLSWSTTEDSFLYNLGEQSAPFKITKRYILSFISQSFDHLGLLAPVITSGKLLMQRLWQLQVYWDESVPTHIHSEFLNYKEQFKQIKNTAKGDFNV